MREEIDYAVSGLEDYCGRLREVLVNVERRLPKGESEVTVEGFKKYFERKVDMIHKMSDFCCNLQFDLRKRLMCLARGLVTKHYENDNSVDKDAIEYLSDWLAGNMFAKYEFGQLMTNFSHFRGSMFGYKHKVYAEIKDCADKKHVDYYLKLYRARKKKKEEKRKKNGL